MRPPLLLAFVALAFASAGGAPALGTAAGPSPFAGAAAALSSQGHPVVVVVSSDGRQVTRAAAGISLTCSDGREVLVQDGFVKLPLSATGRASYRYAGTEATGWDGSPATYSGSVSVSIARRTKVLTGTWQQTQTARNPDGSTRVCSGRVRLRAGARSDPARPLGGSYGGFTSKGRPVVVQVASDGRRVLAISGLFELRCGPGDSFLTTESWGPLALSGGSNRFALVVRNQTYHLGGGAPYQESASASGAIDRAGTRATGRWRTVWTIHTPEATGVCDSGRVTFRATR